MRPMPCQATASVGILNLSSTLNLSPAQNSLLSKGLSFVPHYQNKTHQASGDDIETTAYHRRLKLAAYFHGKERLLKDGPTFQEPSTWEPDPCDLPPPLWDLISDDRTALSVPIFPAQNIDPDNLTGNEWRALQELKADKSIIIKPADKGSSVVLMDRPLYIQEAMRQLHNTDHYRPLDSPIYLDSIPLFKNVLLKLRNEKYITDKQMQYLIGDPQPRARHVYFLPKVHKKASSWTVPEHMPPGRPICSDCGSESYRISSYIDFYLNPLSKNHPSYLKDTLDFLSKLKDIHLSEGDILFTMDVESLYTNIETERGLLAVQEWFRRHPDPNRPDESLLELLNLSLTRNDFHFNEQWFLQIRGTAMGKRFAPAYANVYMAHFEEAVFLKSDKLPSQYFRYLDDVWGVWPHSLGELQAWLQILNEHHPSIKLTLTHSHTAVDFLDLTIFKGPDFPVTKTLDTKVFFKPTDTHALLHHDSFHPPHTFKGIVKSQLIRFDRICSRSVDRQVAIKVLFKALRLRGYSRHLLRRILQDWNRTTPKPAPTLQDGNQTAPEPTPTPTPRVIPIVSIYSSQAAATHSVLKGNFEKSRASMPFAQGIRVISAFRRNKNLGDYLVQSKLPKTRPKDGPRTRTWLVKNPRTGQSFPQPLFLPPSTKNCVYYIKCRTCGKLYVGETRNSLSQRLSTHKYAINTNKNLTPLGEHFRKHGTEQILLRPLAHDANWSTAARRRQEQIWIKKLGSRFPMGLNTIFIQPPPAAEN